MRNNFEKMPVEIPVDIPMPLCQYRAMLGETQKQFSLTRAAHEYMRARKKPNSYQTGG
jgi:hypothetical protein